jgi:hypothetical protein
MTVHATQQSFSDLVDYANWLIALIASNDEELKRKYEAELADYIEDNDRQNLEQLIEWLRGDDRYLEYRKSQKPFISLRGPIAGDILLGLDSQSNQPVRVPIKSLGHTLAIGLHQQGKTTMKYNMRSQAIGMGIPTKSWDIKRDDRHLIRNHPQLLVLDLASPFNPYEPPSNKPMDILLHWMVVAQIILQQSQLLTGAERVMFRATQLLFEDYQRTGLVPTLADLQEKIRSLMAIGKISPNTARGESYSRCVETIGILLEMFPGLRYRKGYPLEQLRSLHVSWEAEKYPLEHAKLVMLWQMFWFFHRELCGKDAERSKRVRQIFFIDEATSVMNPPTSQQMVGGAPFLNKVLQQMKEFGLVLVAMAHNAELVRAIRDNAVTLMAFKTVDSQTTAAIGNILQLSGEQQRYLIKQKPGQAVLRLTDQWDQPIAVQLNNYPLEKTVTDEELAMHNKPLLEGLSHFLEPDATSPTAVQVRISEAAESVLKHIDRHPLLNLTERAMKLGKKKYDLSPLIKELQTAKLIDAKSGAKGGRGSTFTLHKLTDSGLAYCSKLGLEPQVPRRDLVHRYLLEKFAQAIRAQEIEVEIEPYQADDTFPDLVIRCRGCEAVIELQVSGSVAQAIQHLEERLRRFPKVAMAVTIRPLLEGIRREMRQMFSPGEQSRILLLPYRKALSLSWKGWVASGQSFD